MDEMPIEEQRNSFAGEHLNEKRELTLTILREIARARRATKRLKYSVIEDTKDGEGFVLTIYVDNEICRLNNPLIKAMAFLQSIQQAEEEKYDPKAKKPVLIDLLGKSDRVLAEKLAHKKGAIRPIPPDFYEEDP